MSIEPRAGIRPLYRLTQLTVTALFKAVFGLRVEGRENVPLSGGFILASNHKSWFDPPIVGATCPREIFYAAKRELFTKPILGALVKYYNSIPVRRTGFDREVMLVMGEALRTGFGIAIFPEGTRFKDEHLHAPKAGVGLLSLKNNVPIVPVHVANSAFLTGQILRRRLRIRFGKPFAVSELNLGGLSDKDKYKAIALETMNRIAQTGGVNPPS